jgi:hypothetical protein
MNDEVSIRIRKFGRERACLTQSKRSLLKLEFQSQLHVTSSKCSV